MDAGKYPCFILWIVLFLAANVDGTLRFTTAPKDGQVLYACAGNDFSMAWDFRLQPGDVVSSIVWTFFGASGKDQEMVAMFAAGNFIPLPAYSHRVTFLPKAGFTLSHVTAGDAGNYTVTVTSHDGDVIRETRRSVILRVSDSLLTTDHQLHVTQQPEFSNVTGQFHTVLTCGQFAFATAGDPPPISVEWMTPDDQTVASTRYKQGLYLLDLPNPVMPGTYTCRITSGSLNASCAHGEQSRHQPQASVQVNALETRLLLMEAVTSQLTSGQRELRARLEEKEVNVDQLQGRLTDTERLFQARLAEKDAAISQLSDSQHAMRGKQSQLTASLHDLQAKLVERDAVISQLNRTQRTLQNHVTSTERRFQATLAEKDVEMGHLNSSLHHLLTQQGLLRAHNSDLTTQVHALEGDLHALKNGTKATPAIAFTARVSGHQHLQPGATVVMSDVLVNQGNAYDRTTGKFKAPYSGTYFFSAFATAFPVSAFADLYLRSDGSADSGGLFSSWAHNEGEGAQTGSLQGVLRLGLGERVWLESVYNSNLTDGHRTAFSGFLLFVD